MKHVKQFYVTFENLSQAASVNVLLMSSFIITSKNWQDDHTLLTNSALDKVKKHLKKINIKTYEFNMTLAWYPLQDGLFEFFIL